MRGHKTGGRKKGVPNKATQEIREELAKVVTEDYFSALPARLADGKMAPALEVKLLAYRFGEPQQTLKLTGEDGGPVLVRFVDA